MRRASRTCLLAVCLLASGCGDEPMSLQPPAEIVLSPAKLIEALSRAYLQHDDELLTSLLANDPAHNAEYVFLLNEPSEMGETQWGYAEEVRIHTRMFHPERPTPGENPVPAEVWLRSLNIPLTQNEPFDERPDLYSKDSGTDGKLDPALWRATGASYSTNLFFDLAGDVDYKVEGTANFVVIENLQKDVGDPGKFLILVWEDLGPVASHAFIHDIHAVEPPSWGGVKSLYR